MDNNATVKQRRVFYLSGFDPRGAGHYHRMYKSHATQQGQLTGVNYDVGTRRRMTRYLHRWDIKTTDAAGHQVKTEYDFLSWEDIIRAEWSHGIFANLKDFWGFVTGYILSGYVWKFGRPSRQPLIAAFYPVLFVIGCFLLGGLGFYTVFSLLTALGGGLMTAVGFLLAVAAGFFIFNYSFKYGHKLAAFWILRINVFSVHWAEGKVQGIDARIDDFADEVAAALKDKTIDEVIVVGHSVGSMLSIPVVAKAMERTPDLAPGKLKLLTIGACIPLISYHDNAEAYRQTLFKVGHDPRLHWVDYSAKTDGACFYMQNPLTNCGMTQAPGTGPVLLSPRFFKLHSPERYRKLRYDWYRMHFLYMMSGDMIGDYDYFAMTAGAKPLFMPYPAGKDTP